MEIKYPEPVDPGYQKSRNSCSLYPSKNRLRSQPSRTLAGELEQLGKPHKLLIFPRCGNTHAEGHGVFCFQATDVWGPAVTEFLEASIAK
jgi:hypothetical protein